MQRLWLFTALRFREKRFYVVGGEVPGMLWRMLFSIFEMFTHISFGNPPLFQLSAQATDTYDGCTHLTARSGLVREIQTQMLVARDPNVPVTRSPKRKSQVRVCLQRDTY